MLSSRPVTSRILGRLRRRSLIDDAIKTIEISPGTEWPAEVPIHLPDEDGRIIRVHNPDNKTEDDLRLSKYPFVRQGPTRAHCVRDVVIADGTLMSPRSFETIRPEKRRVLLSGPIEQDDERTFCGSSVTEQYWGHWLKDVFCHELLAKQIGADPLILESRNRPHENGYRKLLDMPARPVRLAHVKRLWLLEDYEVNAGRVERLEHIGTKLRSLHEIAGPSRVYLKRGVTGIGRNLLNEAEIIAALEARGFAIVAPEELEADEIVAAVRSARLVVAVEGSAMSHATVTMPRGGGLLAIEPPMRFNMLPRTYCAALGLMLGYTVGDNDDFSQPVDRLLRVVDLMENAIGL